MLGENDRQLGMPTVNRTETNFGLFGADLGTPFEFNGDLWFLFGDSVADATFHGADNLGWRDPDYNDSIAHSSSTNPAECPHLQFVTAASGAYASPVIHSSGAPVTLGNFEVPVSGIEQNGQMYVFFATGYDGAHFSTRSVLTVSSGSGADYNYLYDFSHGPFVNISLDTATFRSLDAKIFGDKSIDRSAAGALLIWGTAGGAGYRNSNPYLAIKPLSTIGSPGSVEYFAGDSASKPRFSTNESDAVAMFNDSPACMGEFSVKWNPHIKRWLMLYNCDPQGGIVMRLAEHPWGPWTAGQIIFQPWNDHGYCYFIHRGPLDSEPYCDNVSDPNRISEWGGWYAPYLIPRYAARIPGGTTVYYLLSTWNPYEVMLMSSEIKSGAK